MARYHGNAPEKFSKCKNCGSKNTKELLSNEDEDIYRYTYFAWCFDCSDTYNYSLTVTTVYDKEKRI